MKDIQGLPDDRNTPIDEVGIAGLRYPIVVLDPERKRRETVAELTLSVALPHHFRGTHMSRFVEVLDEHRGEVTMRTLPGILGALRERLEADSAKIAVRFPYFIEKHAPVTGVSGLVDYECTFVGELTQVTSDFVLGVMVPITTVCPCSKEISDQGAHNQRCDVDLSVRSAPDDSGQPQLIWIEELISVVEESGSSQVFSLLKRPDERHVTMQGYARPVFVEDVVRNVACELQADQRVAWFRVKAVSHESIHNHDVYATITWRRPE